MIWPLLLAVLGFAAAAAAFWAGMWRGGVERRQTRWPIALAAAGLALVLASLVLVIGEDDDDDAPPVAAAPAPPPAEAAAAPKPAGPSFDVVRINPTGDAVMAGRAAPGAEVIILDGGREIGRVRADGRGEWVFVPDKPLPPGARELTLTARAADGVETAGVAPVVLVVPDSRQAAQPEQPVLAVQLDEGGARVLQGPGETLGPGELAITIASQNAGGKITVAGRAAAGGTVHLYLDGQFLGRAQANRKGEWRLRPSAQAQPGTHALRADQVAEGGKVTARVETTLEIGHTAVAGIGEVVVQAGQSLWTIATQAYGNGFDYHLIYQANREQIRDPNVIHPGQVFVVPGR
ncbi:MAG: LysM peptidoglycan-binding domain-containing protein [Alphaproteobacteria bacterium]|nr:LysM peptidoglycan-binding domain-containing protein [Alphaproteobacteria bacterium]